MLCRGYFDWYEVGRPTHFEWFHSVGSDIGLNKKEKTSQALVCIHFCLQMENAM